MYFDDTKQILEIASKSGCAVFVVPDDIAVEIPRALILTPAEKTVITVEQVRDVIEKASTKQVFEQYIVIRPAEKLSEVAENAFLKNLEEPGEKIHYILITAHPSRLLSTILSRAQVYFLRQEWNCREIRADAKEKALVKRLMVASGRDLVTIAEEISAKKVGVREYALRVVGLTIEMLYKTYFLTGKEIFVQKLPKFLKLYENLAQNGHVKLHIVADLC